MGKMAEGRVLGEDGDVPGQEQSVGLPSRSAHPSTASDSEHGLKYGIRPVAGQVGLFLLRGKSLLPPPASVPRTGVSATLKSSEWEMQRLPHPSRKGQRPPGLREEKEVKSPLMGPIMVTRLNLAWVP